MVYFEPLAQYLAGRFNRWVERGRAADASYDQDAACWVMRYRRRHRIQAVVPPTVFGFGCAVAIAVEMAGLPLRFWLRIGFACFILPLLILMCWRAVRVCCSMVLLGESQLTIRYGPFGAKTLDWSKVCSVRYSQLRTAFILDGADGRRLAVPGEMDGVRTFCDFLIRFVEPTAIEPSVPKQMLTLC
jgi:hypothetical protein